MKEPDRTDDEPLNEPNKWTPPPLQRAPETRFESNIRPAPTRPIKWQVFLIAIVIMALVGAANWQRWSGSARWEREQSTFVPGTSSRETVTSSVATSSPAGASTPGGWDGWYNLTQNPNNRGINDISSDSAASLPKLGETYSSTENNYSHKIPEGWQNKPGPQPGVTMIVAPQASGLSSNMVTTVESFAGSLTDYVEANEKALQTSVPDAKLLSDAKFITNGKMTGYKVKLQNKIKDIDLAQTMYFFEDANRRKIIVTCTAPAKFGADLDPLFDECMKTFAFSTRGSVLKDRLWVGRKSGGCASRQLRDIRSGKSGIRLADLHNDISGGR